jgi:preprotein translocase subunit SecA
MEFLVKIGNMFKFIFGKIFGTRNDRELKKYRQKVEIINQLEDKYKSMTDEELQTEFNKLKESVKSGEKTLDEVLFDSFAITREASSRILGLRHYDVQLIGGMVLHDGRIAEMKTGEGKTLVATLPIALNAMTGEGVHLVTVNDYLAKRDAEELKPLYNFLGYSVGVITEDIQDDFVKKEQYEADITYGTNNEFGFDYLRDNMKYSKDEMVQRGHNFVIVDEVDSILIDEARTPLIISGPTDRKLDNYILADKVAKQLKKGEKIPAKEPGESDITTGDFVVDEKNRTVLLTEEGTVRAQELFGVDNLYSLENAILSHHLDQSLKANYLFEKDVDYVVKDGEIVIVDEFTGRLSDGRRYSDGLHQAIEAKEGVQVKEESQTLADITFQNYFRMYKKLAGMTGTAQTEATEFGEIYNVEVISIPTNVPVQRKDFDDLIYKTEKEKFDAVIRKIKELKKKGQPILIGTASIEKSELLSKMLKKEKIPHHVLNAKNHAQEGEIIKNAGQKGAVTIATNMAGRGVDIKLGEGVKELGGLYIIGTERHENRRIDNQLRGRAGRQGDPGASQFYLSLDDNLLRIFGGERIKNIMDKIGVEEGEHLESRMVTRAVENAQKRIEGMYFESRKHIVQYDDVSNEQRKVIFAFRNQLLDKDFDISQKLQENRKEYLKTLLESFSIFEGLPQEDYNLDGLVAALKEELKLNIEVNELKDLDADEVFEKILEKINSEYEKKMSVLDPFIRKMVEKEIYLKNLDKHWREHLYQLDTLKTGIGLRGYNQKDPLVEYKKESFFLFNDLISSIKFETIKTLQLIQFRDPEEESKDFIEKQEQEKKIAEKQNELRQELNRQPHRVEKKPKRNDPCPCGSGKKYKHCCGISGPKKGVFAQPQNN